MKISRVLAVMCAATLAPVALVVPAAHADQSWSGAITATTAKAIFHRPNSDTDKCDPSGSSASLPFNSVSFRSTTDGPRTFAVTGRRDASIFVLRNGACVAADYQWDTGDGDYDTQRVDVAGVQIAIGDQVVVQIVSDTPFTWNLSVTQPGSWNTVTSGTATKYVALPEQVVCATGTATATLTKATKKAAKKHKIRSIVFTANGQRVAKVRSSKVRKAVKQGVVLSGIPKGAVTIEVVVKLRGGKKKTASRSFSAC